MTQCFIKEMLGNELEGSHKKMSNQINLQYLFFFLIDTYNQASDWFVDLL